MAGNERRRKVRGESMALDTMHIVIGIAVVIMAFLSFINPEEYMIFFPVIFCLAAVLNLATGRYRMKRSKRNQKQKLSAVLQMAFGGALLVLTVISAVSIWWR
ncbi:MAG: hypothetical protein MR528_06730 [Lachnospiraceae bacterium]|nr:hypothetical protein [Lachnospiraceae bacterium]